ncbi:MAG: biotin/lipoyl-binding protein, partial [Planctomycetes bacterium]|nr:biotin/lipoyl-binding protein [Planctomycetota bacterium]
MSFVTAAIAAAVVAAAVFHRAWLPEAKQLVSAFSAGDHDSPSVIAPDEDHAGDAHSDDHPGHDDLTSLHLSPQAWKNINLQVGPVELADFERTVTVPAIVVERPGQTVLQVSAPLTGVVTGVFITRGQAIEPGDLLFNLRLTHEDLVQT